MQIIALLVACNFAIDIELDLGTTHTLSMKYEELFPKQDTYIERRGPRGTQRTEVRLTNTINH